MPARILPFGKKRKSGPSHAEIRDMLVRIGQTLGRYAAAEYKEGFWQYDVVWKDTAVSQRVSHVFGIQDRDSLESGVLESGLANLKHLFDIQRSKPFLVISDEPDVKKAEGYLRAHLTDSYNQIADSMGVSNQQKWDTLGAERSSVGWGSGELPEGAVIALSPFDCLSLHLLPAL